MLLVSASPMEVAGGAKKLAVTRELRARLCFARHMVVVGGASILGVLKVPKAVLTTA